MPRIFPTASLALFLVTIGIGCSDDSVERLDAPDNSDRYALAGQCFHIDAATPSDGVGRFLSTSSDGERLGFDIHPDDRSQATPYYAKATDLGVYLLYDDDHQFVVADDEGLWRQPEISNALMELDDDYLPGVQWEVEASPIDEDRLQLRHKATGHYLSSSGLVDDPQRAATVSFHDAEGCADYPELTVDAEGDIKKTTFDDGDLFGYVETHSHLLTNFGFGGAGMFHGAPFHPFGVEHALPNCEHFHGEEGRKDLFGFGFDEASDLDEEELIAALTNGQTPEFNHYTEGYPAFTDWPNAHFSSTHQTQYYKWVQRARKSGLRLMVQHATSNQMICELLSGSDVQPTRYSCDDMAAIDRSLEEVRRMERYIDAQHGGPGKGWFRIVETPEEARQVIADGDLAILLGIEVSNLFECRLVPGEDQEPCDEQDVIDNLDHYYDLGVRAIFPNHKYDNAFSAGDGHREVIELGNFVQTGHYSNFTDDCPDLPSAFDFGDVAFSGLNQPRDDYFSAPPNDLSGFPSNPVGTLLPYLGLLFDGPLEGDYCQNHGLTDLGEFLIESMMDRGMILEIDHLPRRSYKRAFEMLQEHDYPATGTHGNHNRGKLYELGGVSKFNFGRCNDPDRPGGRLDDLNHRLELMEDAGAYPAEGFGFDLNGFAGAPGPRFGDRSVCGDDQDNPVAYPFESFAGDITFQEPQLADRTVDFNTEGMAHIGLVAELIEDVRNDGATYEAIEPLFRSAEGYIRMWERSIERGEALSF